MWRTSGKIHHLTCCPTNRRSPDDREVKKAGQGRFRLTRADDPTSLALIKSTPPCSRARCFILLAAGLNPISTHTSTPSPCAFHLGFRLLIVGLGHLVLSCLVSMLAHLGWSVPSEGSLTGGGSGFVSESFSFLCVSVFPASRPCRARCRGRRCIARMQFSMCWRNRRSSRGRGSADGGGVS